MIGHNRRRSQIVTSVLLLLFLLLLLLITAVFDLNQKVKLLLLIASNARHSY